MNSDTILKTCLVVYALSGLVLAVLGITQEAGKTGIAGGVTHLAMFVVLASALLHSELKERRNKLRPY